MDLYISSMLLGATGLTAMALSGLGSHSHSGGGRGGHGHSGGHAGQAGHGSAGHAHAAHVGAGHAGAHTHGVASHAPAPAGANHSVAHAAQGGASRVLWAIASPRYLFSFCLGFGAAGIV